MKTFLDGKKTYLGLALTLAGVFGLARFITDAELEVALNALFEIVGVAIAVYGRFVARPRG